jgi:mono/diheme cytochrome c family protein
MAIFRQPVSRLPKAVRSPAETRYLFLWAIVLFSFLLTGCTSEDQSAGSSAEAPKTETAGARWYTAEGVSRGAPIFARLCADCHGKKAQGDFIWRQQGADGKFPPPPLNGTAHAWHHPIRALGSQIKFGAPGGSGSMPGFTQTLSDQDVIDLIAWFQDKWSDEIYAAWLVREQQSRASTQ